MRTPEAILADLTSTEVKIGKTSSKLAGIFIRFVLTGIIVYRFWVSQPPEATFLEKLLPSFAFIFCVYFFCWLFVVCLNLTKNYLVAIAAVFICLLGIAFVTNYLSTQNPTLSNALSIACLIGFILLFFYDVYRVIMLPMQYIKVGNLKKEYVTTGPASYTTVESTTPQANTPPTAGTPITTSAQSPPTADFSSPAFAARAAASLEKTLGRTPTDQEVNDFIADLAKE